MGRANPVLTVWIAGEYEHHPAIKELVAAGHDVLVIVVCGQAPPRRPDLILHPAAGWSEELFEEVERKDGTTHRPYVQAALVGARARRKK